jgi:hypothetical protein
MIRLSGRATAPIGIFSVAEHRLRAEIYKQGELYVPQRVIYSADAMDTAFGDRYRPAEWVKPATLRFPGAWGRREGPPDILTVQNECQGLIRSLRVDTAQDMFVILDIAPGRPLSVPMTAQSPSGDLNWLRVAAEWGDTIRPSEASAAFSLRGGREARFEFVITVSPDRIDFAETRGPAERYR